MMDIPMRSRSGHKGVSAKHKKFYARIKINGKSRHLGTFPTPEAASAAYMAAAREHFGDFVQ